MGSDIITLHMGSEHDTSPLYMISKERLAHLHRIEALAMALVRELNSPAGEEPAAELVKLGPQPL